MFPNPLVAALATLVGVDHVLIDDDVRASYERDWTGRYGGRCTAVVRPGSTAEVAAVLAACNELGVAVIPQAGNTGLVGGGVPRRGGRPFDEVGAAGRIEASATDTAASIVLSLRRLDTITDVDTASMALTAGAGVTLAGWRQAARRVGLDAPLDFAARDSATVGGAIATNAGGSRVVRFGTMRQQVLGVEAVLADGTIIGSLAGLPKETVGVHWPSVLAGSEGTLGVITAARLRLVSHYAEVVTAMVSLDGMDAALELLAVTRRRLGSLDSIEFVHPEAISLVAEHLCRPAPVELADGGVVVLLECADHRDPSPELLDVLAGSSGVVDSALATSGERRAELLAFRDRITESIAAATVAGPPTFKLDVAVPLPALGSVIELARDVARRRGARVMPFGHLAEGNVHLNFLEVPAGGTDGIAEEILPAVARFGGTISAEHGVGIAKTRWLHLVRSPGDLVAGSTLRRALDPNGVLNPGVLDPRVLDPRVLDPGGLDPPAPASRA